LATPKNKGESYIIFDRRNSSSRLWLQILDEDGVAIGAGHHWLSNTFTRKLGLPATARASFGVSNTKDDIDQLNNSINKCKKIFNLK
jgi:Selenocysteine lyase